MYPWKYLFAFAAVTTATQGFCIPVSAATNDTTAISSLSGETCAVVPLSSPPAGDLPSVVRPEAVVQCGDRKVGNVASMPAPPATATGMAVATIEPLRRYLAPEASYDCAPAKAIPGEDRAFLLPCRERANGWAMAIVARWRDGRVLAASGPASAWPALKAAAGLPASAAPLTDQKAEIVALWPYPVTIASAADQALVQSLRDTARLSNSHFAFAEGESALRRALDVQVRLFGEQDPVAAAILMDTAAIVANQGRYEEADRLLQRAGPIIDVSPRPADRARLAGYQANIAWLRGDIRRALDSARSATEQWRAIVASESNGAAPDAAAGNPPTGTLANPLADPLAPAELAMALNREAGFGLQQDDPASANARASEALLQLGKAGDAPRWWKADVLANLGASSIALGRLSAGEAYFKAAIDLRRAVFGEDQGTLRMRVTLARAYQAEGLNTAAIVTYREAMKVARGLPRESVPFTAEDLIPLAAAVVNEGAALTDPKARQGLFAEAFDAFQLAASPGRDRTVALTTQRLAASTPALADLLRAVDDAETDIVKAREALAAAQARPADEQDPAELERLQAEAKRTEARLAGVKKDLATRYPDYLALLSPALPTLDSVRARLADNEALVTFLIGRRTSFVQLVRRGGVTLAQVPAGAAELAEAVRGLRHGLEIEGKAVADFDIAAANRLYTRLLGPVEGELAGAKRLIVVSGGPLASLPFAVLVTRPARTGDYAGSHWLVQDMAITHTPSLASFVALRSTRLSSNQARTLLAVADPKIGEQRARAALAAVRSASAAPTTSAMPSPFGACRSDAPVAPETLREMAALPDTLREVSSVARALGGDATVLNGRKATETALRAQALNQYRILYFATHGVIPGELRCQAEPGLVLTPPDIAATTRADDGMLDASEIATLDLRADLVVLSACNTAGGGNQNGMPGSGPMGGETLSGLALAFFHAGARNLVVTHWQVPSAATARLMTDTFAAMHANTDTSIDDALRHAQLRALRDPASAHPFFWGAFVVLGDGAAQPLQQRTPQ